MGLERAGKLTKKLLRCQAIALDTNIFIYALEGHPDFPTATELFTHLPGRDCRVITSVITLAEALTPLYRSERYAVIDHYLGFISGYGAIEVKPVDRSISVKAAELRARYQLKTPDAIHLATALMSGAEVFVTADRDFPKQVERLRIINL